MKTQLFDYADMIGKTVSGVGTNSAKSNLAIAFTDDTFILINCEADDCDVDASMGPVALAIEPERLACVYKVFGGFVLELQDGRSMLNKTAAEAVNAFCHIAKIEANEALMDAANDMERYSADINRMAELKAKYEGQPQGE